jgi:hypothetical protein
MDAGRPPFSVTRDRLGTRLGELARKLIDPTPTDIERVRAELDRLARG